MSDSGSGGRSWNEGDIENNHILTASGWVPFRNRAPDSGPEKGGQPWQVGDVVSDHVFTGQDWVVVPPVQSSQPQASPPAYQAVVASQTAKSPNWFMKWSIRKRVLAICGVVLVLIVAGSLGSQGAGPEKQEEFVAIVATGQDTKTDNDTQVVRAKRVRGDALCDLLPSNLKVTDWTGTLTEVTTELGGDDGEVKIEIGKGVDVVSKDIDPDSKIFSTITSLEEGSEVTFSGEFEGAGDNCIFEDSLTSSNGLRTPDFGIKLTSID